MYEALQYFNPVTFSEVLKKMNVMEKGSLFFIASIPDKAHLFEYYDTPEKKKFYYECEERKEPHIGYWWDVDDLKGISEENGFDFTYLNQSPDLYTGYYRFNCLLEKK
ncbi:MAG: hypothetical protein ACLVKO_07500 [Dysgonomonas sp.]